MDYVETFYQDGMRVLLQGSFREELTPDQAVRHERRLRSNRHANDIGLIDVPQSQRQQVLEFLAP